MKLDRTEIAVIAVFILAIVTANAYVRGKALRYNMDQARRAAHQHDAGVVESAEGGTTTQTPDADTRE